MIYLEDGSVVPVEKDELPIKLPNDVDLNASGNHLDQHPKWKKTFHKKTGKPATRETDTLDTFVEFFMVFHSILFSDLKTSFEEKKSIIGCQLISILEV